MKTLALAALAVALTAGAAAAQSGSGSAAGGPLGDVSRRNGVDPWGTTYTPPGVWVPGVVLDEPDATGTVILPNDRAPREELLIPRGAPRY